MLIVTLIEILFLESRGSVVLLIVTFIDILVLEYPQLVVLLMLARKFLWRVRC